MEHITKPIRQGEDNSVQLITSKLQNVVTKRVVSERASSSLNRTCEDMGIKKRRSDTMNNEKRKVTLYTKARVNSWFTLLLVALTVVSSRSATIQENFKITQLPDTQPIYFDRVGNVQMIHDEWKLLVYYNMTTFWEATTKIEKYVDHLNEKCNTTPQEPCHSTIKQLQFEMSQLKEYNAMLLSEHLQRKRRGLINAVGNIQRYLFGVLDNDFAEKYAQDIQNIQNNEQYLVELIKNQTLIVEAEDNIVKKNEEFVEAQLKLINTFIEQTANNTEAFKENFRIIKTMNDINAGAITASSLISVLRRNQQMFIDALTDIYKGHLDMKLFTPQQLMNQLNYIISIVSKKSTSPIEEINMGNIRDIYKLIYVKARLTRQYLLFELHIPLLSHDDYTLYRNVPIPTKVANDECQAIAITSNYIGVNFARNTYIQMEEADLHKCSTMNADNYICRTYTPVYNLHKPTASCEAKILSQQSNNITCNVIPHKCSDQWTKLERPNVWLYNCYDECQTRIVCENRIVQTPLKKTGLLALDHDCLIQHNDVTIFSNNVYNSETKTGMSLEVPNVESPNDMWNSTTTTKIIRSNFNSSDAHRLLEQKIAAQKERENLPNNLLSTHDINNYVISSLLLGALCVAFTVCLVKRCIGCQRKTINRSPIVFEN